MVLPLSGLKVLDLSRLLPGPYATLLLADLGAEVLKIEDPQLGDYMRDFEPRIGGQNAVYQAVNRNKGSLSLNLKSNEGRAIFRQLAAEYDIVLESFRPGVMARLGLGWEELHALNPGLIYCAISGYGQDGPYSQRVGHDLNYIGYAGALGQSGPKDGSPALSGVQIADLAGGALMAVVGILAAVNGRHSTGEGRFVDISMTDGVAALMTYQLHGYLANEVAQPRGTSQLNGGLPEYNVYQTADGRWLTVAALEPKFFSRLCQLLDLSEYAETGTSGARAAAIGAALAYRFKEKSRDEWLELLADQEVCVGPVYELDEVLADPQLTARGVVQEFEHPQAGRIRQIGLPFKLSDLPPEGIMRAPAPTHGQQTDEVLTRLGYDAAQIAELRQQGVV